MHKLREQAKQGDWYLSDRSNMSFNTSSIDCSICFHVVMLQNSKAQTSSGSSSASQACCV
jgi:hypothetical protein